MRFDQLTYFAAVTRFGSLRRAAKELHISQPALSETLRNLERELGTVLLDRRRSGARVSSEGRELLPFVNGVLEAVDRLNRAADAQRAASLRVRVGTVNAATVALLAPAIEGFRSVHLQTPVEVIPAQQSDIHRALREGAVDLGLVNVLEGDDLPSDLSAFPLLTGPVVVCLRPDDPLAAQRVVDPEDLFSRPLIMMRSGYVMHRFLSRLFDGRSPDATLSMDGAEMGKIMVAEGLGVTVLPEYSVVDDPLERLGAITTRPLAGEHPLVRLVLQHLPSPHMPYAVRDLHAQLVTRAAAYTEAHRVPDPTA